MTNGNDTINVNHSGYENHGNGDGIAFVTHEGGLNKREYFAAIALQGMLANPALYQTVVDIKISNSDELYAISAVEQADALIEALNKEK